MTHGDLLKPIVVRVSAANDLFGRGSRTLALLDDSVDRLLRGCDIGDHDCFEHQVRPNLVARRVDKDVFTQRGNAVRDRRVEHANGNILRFGNGQRLVDQGIFGLLDLKELAELIHREWSQLDGKAGLDASRQRSGVGRDEIRSVDLGRTADRVEHVAGEGHVEHFLDHDRLYYGRDCIVLARHERIQRVEICRDGRMLEFHGLLQRFLHRREARIGRIETVDEGFVETDHWKSPV